MTTTFDADKEIDALVDKLAEQLKTRLHKIVERSEKQALRQFQASQRESGKKGKGTTTKTKTKAPAKKTSRRSDSDESESESGSDS